MNPDVLVVHTDIPLLQRKRNWIVIAHSILLILSIIFLAVTLGWVSSTSLSPLMALAPTILVMGQVFQIAINLYAWNRRLAITQPLTVGYQGLTVSTEKGSLQMPWASVASVTQTAGFGQQMLLIRGNPQAIPGQGDLVADPAMWRKVTTKGVRIGAVGITVPMPQILAAIQHYSQGQSALR